MKIIRDTIHGDIFFSDSDISLLDTLPIQRLRNVSQLGTVSWVFPGASHTRFEHTIGVVHLAKRILRSLIDIEKYRELVDILSAAAIFHDAGHPPFSHSIEEFGILTKRRHEERSMELAKETIESLGNTDLSASDVVKILGKKMAYLSDIIAGTLDADRLDYLNRDAHHTGVSYGVIDSRIVSLFAIVKDRLAIDERAVIPGETVLFARYVMSIRMTWFSILRNWHGTTSGEKTTRNRFITSSSSFGCKKSLHLTRITLLQKPGLP